MAPTSNSSKLVQHNRPRQATPKAIVPAIPLPFIQRKKQQLAAREKAKEEAAQTQIVEPEPEVTPPVAEIIPAVVYGSFEDYAVDKVVEADEVEELVESPEPAVSPTPIVEEEAQEVEETANEEHEVSIQEVATAEVQPSKYK